MAESKKPAGRRPAGFADVLSPEDATLLAEEIAKYQSLTAERERDTGKTDPVRQRFLDERAAVLKIRAVLIECFGMDRCAGCRYFEPSVKNVTAGWCVRTSCRPDRRPSLPASGWCGQYRSVLPDQK